MKNKAWHLRREASGASSPSERKRLLREAQRLGDERLRIQKDPARAVTHPWTHHTPAASGAQEGEPRERFPRALRKTLLDLGVEQTLADKLIRVEGEKGQVAQVPGPGKGQKGQILARFRASLQGEGTKGKGTGNKGGGKKGMVKKGKGKR